MKGIKAAIERLPSIFRYLMVLGVVIFISFLFPNNLKFKYKFEKGRTWQYEDLEAPFDFAINKTDEEIQADLEALDKDFAPYYNLDTSVITNKKRQFQSAFEEQLQTVSQDTQFPDVKRRPQRYLNYGYSFLDKIYEEGIITLSDQHADKGKDFVINVLSGNKTHKQTLENFMSVDQAKSVLSDELPYSELPEPDFLLPILDDIISPSLQYDSALTTKLRDDLVASVPKTRGMVRKGEIIINSNSLVTDENYQKLISLRQQYEKQLTESKPRQWIFLGYFLLTSLIIGVFMLYLRFHAIDVYKSSTKILFIFLWLALYSYLVYLVENISILSAYIIPFCIVPIVIKTFFNARLALFTHIVVVLIASFLSSLGYEFTFLQILAGIIVLLTNVDTREWTRFFYSMLFIFLTYSLSFLGLSLIQEGDIISIDWTVYSWIFLNVLFTLLAIPLVPLLERFFGFTSAITLVELSDMNRPLLRDLSLKAPGTWQHSLQVANLSEAAARKIGANHLLVKVAALYHDIGKMLNPEYFIENQSGKNPHNDLSDLESAKMIISHVTEGEKIAKKARLPKLLIDFIRTHHGTTRTEYFYRNFVKDHPDMEVDEADFRYPGPRPRTKEETILMIADSIEAACKSLKNPTEQDLSDLINKIIAGKITHGQLEESEMTFEELELCRNVFKTVMKSVHHVRIEYPDEKQAETKE
jgi:putative nucleotidyltransferase with HDIG domain